MKKVLIFLTVLFFGLTIVQIMTSFGVFETKVTEESDLDIAKWHILVNDYDMNAEDHTFYIDQISYTDRFGKPTNQFAPGCTGTFDLIIDPTDTEVSFTYQLKIDMSENQLEQITVDQVLGLNGIQLTQTEDTYSRTMTLNEIEEGKRDTIRVIFHWQWDEQYNESDSTLGMDPDSTFTIPITIHFQQYIG